MVCRWLLLGQVVVIVVRRRWTSESSPDCGIGEVFVTDRKVCEFLWWGLDCRFVSRFGVVVRRCVVRLLDAGGSSLVLPIRSVFGSFRVVFPREVREVDRFDVEGFVAA